MTPHSNEYNITDVVINMVNNTPKGSVRNLVEMMTFGY